MGRFLLFMLAWTTASSSKTSAFRSVVDALDVVDALEDVITTVMHNNDVPVDAQTLVLLDDLSRYASRLLSLASTGADTYEGIVDSLALLRTRYEVRRADLDNAINNAGYAAESHFKFMLYNPPTTFDGNWLSYLGVTQDVYNRLLGAALTTPTGIKHDPSRMHRGRHFTFDTPDLLALALRWARSTDDFEGLAAQWRVLPGNFGRHRNEAAKLLNEALKSMPEADVVMPSKDVQILYAYCLAQSDDDVRLTNKTYTLIKPIGLIDAYPVSVPEFGGRYCQASFMNVKYGGHCILNVKAISPDGLCFWANVNIPGGSSEWTAAQPVVSILRDPDVAIPGACLIGDSLYRVKKAGDVFLAVPKAVEDVSPLQVSPLLRTPRSALTSGPRIRAPNSARR
jgi:hypothetical protein